MAKSKTLLAQTGRAKDAPSVRDDQRESRSRDQRSIVNSLAKGLRVLESFTADRLEMTLSEIATASKLDPGTTFRMTNTLEVFGYLARVPDTKRFRLTLKAADLGLHAIAQADLREVARPILRSLVGDVNEAASLGVLDGGDVLYIDRVRAGAARLGVDIRIGTTIPASCSHLGHAQLAYLPQRDLRRVLSARPRAHMNVAMRISRRMLDQRLREVRELGYSLGESYLENGLLVLALPILDSDGYPLASLSVAAPAARVDPQSFRKSALGPAQQAAGELARVFQAGGSLVATK